MTPTAARPRRRACGRGGGHRSMLPAGASKRRSRKLQDLANPGDPQHRPRRAPYPAVTWPACWWSRTTTGSRAAGARARARGLRGRARGDGAEAARRGSDDGDHDLVVLDIGLPGIDGLEVCRRVRARRTRGCRSSSSPRAARRARRGRRPRRRRRRLRHQAVPLAELLARVRAQLRRDAPRRRRASARSADVRVDPARPPRVARTTRSSSSRRRSSTCSRCSSRDAGHGRPARAHHGRGLGRELVRLDEDARHARRPGCGASSATPPTACTTVRGVGFRFERVSGAAPAARLDRR